VQVLKTLMWSILAFALPASGKVPPEPKVSTFVATLTGSTEPTNTGSKAQGTAVIKVDKVRQSVSIDLAVIGITRDGLWDQLVAAPIGPIHLHKYGSHNHTGSDVTLVLPIPYSPAYRDTARGFRVVIKTFPYYQGAKLLNSDQSFDQFVAALTNGQILLNIHTDAFHDGEISGAVTRG
jgi:CHRD domain